MTMDEGDEACNRSECDLDPELHAFMLKIEFFLDQSGEETKATAAEIHSHLHNVPVEPVVQSLITVAMTFLEENLAHADHMKGMPHQVAHLVAKVMAREYVKHLLDKLPTTVDMSAFTVPDDLSGLLGD